MLWAVVPLKCGDAIKQRLGALFSVAERRVLCRAMVCDLLDALGACPEVGRTLLLSSDTEAVQLAAGAGAEHAPDPGGGLNEVAAAAARMVAERGGTQMLLVHADLPAAGAEEFSRLLADFPAAGPALHLVEDRCGRGSNVLLCTPPGVVPFHYGEDSAEQHLRAAQARGAAVRRSFFPGLSLDVDTPEDVRELLRRFGASKRALHTRALLDTPQMRRQLEQWQAQWVGREMERQKQAAADQAQDRGAQDEKVQDSQAQGGTAQDGEEGAAE